MPSRPPIHGQQQRREQVRHDKRERARAVDRRRYREHDRAFYGRDAWTTLSRYVRACEPLCRECMRFNRIRAATEVDHIIDRRKRPDLAYDLANLQPLCRRCHSRKTMRDMRNETERHPVYVVSGLPGSGKSTWVNERRKPGDVVWDYDAVLATLTQLPMHSLPPALAPVMEAMLNSLTRQLQAQPLPDRSVYIIASNRDKAATMAEHLRGSHVHLEIDEDERLRRINQRNENKALTSV